MTIKKVILIVALFLIGFIVMEVKTDMKEMKETKEFINEINHEKFCEIAISRESSNEDLRNENCIK